jgi:minor histocompatibility antigen H13
MRRRQPPPTARVLLATIISPAPRRFVSPRRYATTKHWIANNVIGVALAMQGIQLLQLNSFTTGAIVLVGLFVYDIYWVFGTDVMVSVAVGLDAPIKLLFLRAHATHDTRALHSMLGLGDIVVPGLYVALSLRFDRHCAALRAGLFGDGDGASDGSGKGVAALAAGWSKPYFNAQCIAYALGLMVTIVVMFVFESAQPALLYLSPACLLATLVVAVARGEVREVLAYTEEAEEAVVGGDQGANDAAAAVVVAGGAESGAEKSKDN